MAHPQHHVTGCRGAIGKTVFYQNKGAYAGGKISTVGQIGLCLFAGFTGKRHVLLHHFLQMNEVINGKFLRTGFDFMLILRALMIDQK
ncbi:hypothetical protein D3C78_1606300 [compost metagenome]